MENKHFWKAWLARFLFLGLVIIIIIIGWLCWRRPVTTVLLVRHAEKIMQGTDPPLNNEGQARALSLAHVAGEAGVTAIYASQYQRTQQTVEPLSTQLGLTVIQINSTNVNGLVEHMLSNYAGGVVLVAGHSDTIPLIISELGGGPISPIQESEYDNLFVLTVFRFGDVKVLNLKYGDPS